MSTHLSAEDALYGFVAWLTTRDQVSRFGSNENCSPAVELVTKFLEANDLNKPSNNYPNNISFPKEESAAPACFPPTESPPEEIALSDFHEFSPL